jgi:peptidoglycan/xylan/chitin deacetylase (PgdA/CDA1 family)
LILQLVTYFLLRGDEETGADIQLTQITPTAFNFDTTFNSLHNQILITGAASEPSAISLERDGLLVATTMTQKGIYTFPSQELHHGANYFAVYGMHRAGVAQKIDSFLVFFQSQRITSLAVPVEQITTSEPVFALTFDAGSEAVGADSILAILREKGISVTIFMTGLFIKRYPWLVKEIVTDGHETANHTFSHPHLTTYSKNMKHRLAENISCQFVQEQLFKTDSIFQALTGNALFKYWRAPFGEYNQEILRWAAEAGYRHIGWSNGADTRDWVADTTSTLYLTSEQILHKVLMKAKADRLKGAIVLMHLNSSRTDDHAYEILRRLIDELKMLNYRFMTVSELLRFTKPS